MLSRDKCCVTPHKLTDSSAGAMPQSAFCYSSQNPELVQGLEHRRAPYIHRTHSLRKGLSILPTMKLITLHERDHALMQSPPEIDELVYTAATNSNRSKRLFINSLDISAARTMLVWENCKELVDNRVQCMVQLIDRAKPVLRWWGLLHSRQAELRGVSHSRLSRCA